MSETAQPPAADREQLPETAYWVALKQVPHVGPSRFRRLLEQFGSIAAAWEAPERKLRAAVDERAVSELITLRNSVDVAALWDHTTRHGIRVTCWTDDDYPYLLREVPAPPPILYYRGQLAEVDRTAVAIVGTRRATAYGREMAHRIAFELATAGVTIVSGLALGIDGVAHRAALEAGGRTLAVLGSGIDVVYPGSHRDLAGRIANQGAVMTDYPLGTQPDRFNFPPRNRIISGLSLGVVVVEAPERSGALLTVSFAAEQSRDAFAVPGPVHAPASAGCLRILREGATLVRSADDILEDLHILQPDAAAAPAQQTLPMSEHDRRFLAVLTTQPQHIDDISAQLSLSPAEVSAQLMMLELVGAIKSLGSGYYVRT